MMFFFNKLLYLFFLLPILILFLLYNYINKKPIKYPSIIYFNEQKKIKNKYFHYIKDILRFALIILIFSLSIIYVSVPHIKSDKIEYLIIYVDNTPFLNINKDYINRIIDSLKEIEDFNKIKIFTNYKELYYPIKQNIGNSEVLTKQDVLMRFYSVMYSLRTNSIKYIFISDRKYVNFDYFNEIKTQNNRVFLYSIHPGIIFYSNKNSKGSMEFLFNDKLIHKESISIKKGYNYFFKNNIKFNKIIIMNDTFLLNKVYKLKEVYIQMNDTNKYIQEALNVLGYVVGDNASISIGIDREINKGIYFSRYGKYFVEKKGIIKTNKSIKYDFDFSFLHYKTLDHKYGDKIVFDSEGNILISKLDSVYFVNIPIDTGYSNFVFIPDFIRIIDCMIKDLSPNDKINKRDRNFINYNFESSQNRIYEYYNQNVKGSKNIQNIILIGVLLCVGILFLLSYFL